MKELSEHHESMQRLIDTLFSETKTVPRLDVIVRAETLDLPEEILGIFERIPPGRYTRARLCDQLNSAIVGHGWGGTLGTFD